MVTFTYDTKKVGEGESRVVRTPFPASTLGKVPQCVLAEGLVVVCAHGTSLHLLPLSSSSSRWESREVGGAVARVRVHGAVVEAETAGGVVRVDTGGGAVVRGEQGVGASLSGGCGGVEVRQKCKVEGVGAGC